MEQVIRCHCYFYDVIQMYEKFYSSGSKQCNQSCSDTTKYLYKMFLVISQLVLTIFDDPGTENGVNMCESRVQHASGWKASLNRFQLVFHLSYYIFQNERLATGLKKTSPSQTTGLVLIHPIQFSFSLFFSPTDQTFKHW